MYLTYTLINLLAMWQAKSLVSGAVKFTASWVTGWWRIFRVLRLPAEGELAAYNAVQGRDVAAWQQERRQVEQVQENLVAITATQVCKCWYNEQTEWASF